MYETQLCYILIIHSNFIFIALVLKPGYIITKLQMTQLRYRKTVICKRCVLDLQDMLTTILHCYLHALYKSAYNDVLL